MTRRAVGDDGDYVSNREVAERAGMDLDLLQRMERAIGLARVDDPDEQVLLRADAEAAAYAQRFVELGLVGEHMLDSVRVLAEGLANAAEAMRGTALAAVSRKGATELDIAKASWHLVSQAAPLMGSMVTGVLLVQLRHAMNTEAVNATERASGLSVAGARDIAVAFGDLVDFTRLGEAVEPEKLEALARRLADIARDVAVPPVRFVKTIGDAVMLVCDDPVALMNAMLDLAEGVEADPEVPRLRIGIAFGEAVSRAGDWFGSPVNLANRVTGAARPGTILVSEAARAAVGDADGFAWSYAGRRHLKHIKDETRLFRVRRPATGGRGG
jgi:adenylate cyclase